MVMKIGVGYLTDAWDVIGRGVVDPNSCGPVTTGGRNWGYLSIEQKMSAEHAQARENLRERLYNERNALQKRIALAEIQKRRNAIYKEFSFYDFLVMYLPGSIQSRRLDSINAEYREVLGRPAPPREIEQVDEWEYMVMKERKAEINDTGFIGTNYKTCLPESDSFEYKASGKPPERTSCPAGQILAQFTIEIWIRGGDELTLTITDDSILSKHRF